MTGLVRECVSEILLADYGCCDNRGEAFEALRDIFLSLPGEDQDFLPVGFVVASLMAQGLRAHGADLAH